jgi:hypothetical protein
VRPVMTVNGNFDDVRKAVSQTSVQRMITTSVGLVFTVRSKHIEIPAELQSNVAGKLSVTRP